MVDTVDKANKVAKGQFFVYIKTTGAKDTLGDIYIGYNGKSNSEFKKGYISVSDGSLGELKKGDAANFGDFITTAPAPEGQG